MTINKTFEVLVSIHECHQIETIAYRPFESQMRDHNLAFDHTSCNVL